MPSFAFGSTFRSPKAREHFVMLLILLFGCLLLARACAAPALAQTPDPEAAISVMRHRQGAAPLSSLTLAQDRLPTPPADIPWPTAVGFREHVDTVTAAFNYARGRENAEVGATHLKPIALPDNTTWQDMSDGERALWLLNEERTARGLPPLHGLETNVTQVAQAFADYLLAHNAFDHNADGRSPVERLDANPAIRACREFLPHTENLAWKGTTDPASIPLPIEQAVYSWIYADAIADWGHRHTVFVSFNENSGPSDREGLLGIGHARGPFVPPTDPMDPTHGKTIPYTHMVVMNIFDPCATWEYAAPPPPPAPPPSPEPPPPVEPPPNTHSIIGKVDLPVWETIAYQPFERDTWPGGWQVSDASGATHGEYHWIPATCRVFEGQYSGMAVGGGADGAKLACDDHYPNNARSWMIYGPFSLQDAIAAEMRAKVWVYTEPYNDMLCMLASTDRKIFNGPCVSGFSEGWVDEVFDLSKVYRMGSMLGRREVYVAFAFITNETETRPHGGVYVDNIELRKGVRTDAAQVGTITAEEPHVLHGVAVVDQDGNFTMTDRDGVFTLEGLPPGQHRLTPIKAGYQFYPPHFTVTITDRDVTGVVFTASSSVHHMLYMPLAQRR